jgi:hypothetical protein
MKTENFCKIVSLLLVSSFLSCRTNSHDTPSDIKTIQTPSNYSELKAIFDRALIPMPKDVKPSNAFLGLCASSDNESTIIKWYIEFRGRLFHDELSTKLSLSVERHSRHFNLGFTAEDLKGIYTGVETSDLKLSDVVIRSTSIPDRAGPYFNWSFKFTGKKHDKPLTYYCSTSSAYAEEGGEGQGNQGIPTPQTPSPTP